MRRLLLVAGLLLLLPALPAVAQEGPRAEVFGGYSYTRLNPGGLAGNEFNLNGWHAGIQGNPTGWFGLVGDFSGHYGTRAGSGISSHQYLFGPRVMVPGTFRPFAHTLFGVARGNAGLFGSTQSDAAFGMAVGGGLDVGGGVTWRVVQVDYLMTRFFDARQDNMRISTGLVFRF